MSTAKTTAVPGIKRRWLASAIVASADPAAIPALPFRRGQRRRPAAVQGPRNPAAIAAR